jgi:hypothetical protein
MVSGSTLAVLACSPGGGGGAGGGAGLTLDCKQNPTHSLCAGDAKGGDGIAADGTVGPDVPAGTEAGPICVPACTGKVCGSDGCGGLCGSCEKGTTCAGGQCVAGACGDGGVSVEGVFKVQDGIAFDQASVVVSHKMDIDAVEDGCLTHVEVTFQLGSGCVLKLTGGEVQDPAGGLRASEITFVADSQCPGFSDTAEGTYDSLSLMKVARIVSSPSKVQDKNAAESCLQASFKVELEGVLMSPEEKLTVGKTELVVTGEFTSFGSTTAGCPCKPACADRECGSDGCGFTCGTCSSEQEACDEEIGQCVCKPYCDGDAECGDDGCGGACGTCPTGMSCNDSGQCVATCTPKCTGKQCGNDGCGGTCGTCATGKSCNPSGQCLATCTPNCTGKVCGIDGCGGTCGTCTTGKSCNPSGQCVATCTPNCTGKQCGIDGCGGTCGTCATGKSCNTTGECVATCTADCADKVCGDDGCGGSCGTCQTGEICSAGGFSCEPTGGACGEVTYEGCCDGTELKYCENNQLLAGDCSTNGCGWDDQNGYYTCGFSGSDPSGFNPKTCP